MMRPALASAARSRRIVDADTAKRAASSSMPASPDLSRVTSRSRRRRVAILGTGACPFRLFWLTSSDLLAVAAGLSLPVGGADVIQVTGEVRRRQRRSHHGP